MIKWINKKRNKKGFTLVELVVVIAILGILAAIAIPRFGGFTEKAKLAGDLQYGALLGNAAVMYFAVNPEITNVDISTLVEEDLIEEVTLKSKDYKGKDNQIKINVAQKDIDEVKDDGVVTQAAVKKGDVTVLFNGDSGVVVYPVAK